MTDRWTEWFKK